MIISTLQSHSQAKKTALAYLHQSGEK